MSAFKGFLTTSMLLALVLGTGTGIVFGQPVPGPPAPPTVVLVTLDNPGTGGTVDGNGGTVEPTVNNNMECDNLNYCRGVAECVPVNGPNGCNFEKTIASVPVGFCVERLSNQCRSAPPGGGIICMVLEYRIPGGTTDNCQNPCGIFQVVVGGECKAHGT